MRFRVEVLRHQSRTMIVEAADEDDAFTTAREHAEDDEDAWETTLVDPILAYAAPWLDPDAHDFLRDRDGLCATCGMPEEEPEARHVVAAPPEIIEAARRAFDHRT